MEAEKERGIESSLKKKRVSLGTCCAVPTCKRKSNVDKSISWSVFPANQVLCEEWVRRIRRSVAYDSFIAWKPTKYSKICGLHFDISGKRKQCQKLPTLLLNTSYNKEEDTAVLRQAGIGHNIKSKENIQVTGRTTANLTEEPNNEEVAENVVVTPNYSQELDEIVINSGIDDATNEPAYDVLSEESDSSLENNGQRSPNYITDLKRRVNDLEKQICLLQSCQVPASELLEKNKELESKINDLSEALDDRKFQISNLEQDNKELHKLVEDFKLKISELENSKFHYKNILRCEEKLQFYTGFKTKIRYENFLTLVLDCYNSSPEKKTCGRKCILPPEEQIFLYLCRLRLGLLEKDLAFRFGISYATVSRICSLWCPFISDVLQKVPIWLSRKAVDEVTPEEIKTLFPNLRLILDATELFVETATDFQVQGATWSNYKHHTTAKGLVGIAPNAFITFVSDLAAGKTSDKKLTKMSGLYKLLEHDDLLLADKGFLIQEELRTIGVKLNIPPFLGGRPRLPENEEIRCRQIAKYRIHVERVISCIKKFRILKTTYPNSMHYKLNDVWKTCVLLCNFIDEPLLERK